MTEGLFDLTGRVAVITGGAGLLGVRHAEAIASAGGVPWLVDIDGEAADRAATTLAARLGTPVFASQTDITDPADVTRLLADVLARAGRVDILINNAANNPTAGSAGLAKSRVEEFPLESWHRDLAVGLTGSFLCCQVIGAELARQGHGVIVNVASDLAMISPDQRLYAVDGLAPGEQPVKPITYSVIKTALLGMTRYLSTYWAEQGVRVNTLSPGGVFTDQSDVFLERVTARIPLGRMAGADEYQGAILFLCSDASSYMTGGNLVVDGGRTIW